MRSNAHGNGTTAKCLIGVLLPFMLGALLGADPGLPTLPDRLESEGGPPSDGCDYFISVASASKGKDGAKVAEGITAYPRYLRQGRRLGSDLLVRYPNLQRGDLIAVFGNLFRVQRIDTDTSSRTGREVGFLSADRIPPEKYPAGVTVPRRSLVIPLEVKASGGARLHDARVVIRSIHPAAKAGEKPSAKVVVADDVEGRVDQNATFALVREGDIVLLRKAAHKVLSIVPPDPKTRVIGWVALDPRPILEADLVKFKTPFIRPEKPKK